MYGVVWVSLIWMYTTEVRKLDLIKKPHPVEVDTLE